MVKENPYLGMEVVVLLEDHSVLEGTISDEKHILLENNQYIPQKKCRFKLKTDIALHKEDDVRTIFLNH